MPVTIQTYRTVALEDPERQWELLRGHLMEKPAMCVSHDRTMARLAHQLSRQIDVNRFEVRTNTGRLRYADETYFIPDVHIVPVILLASDDSEEAAALEVIGTATPFVAKVWSPSTGGYDVDRKLPEYQRRGDAEIWRIHPYDRTVTIWRRLVGGQYEESIASDGQIRLAAFQDAIVDLNELFDFGSQRRATN